MPRADRQATPPTAEEVARKRGMSVLRGAQQRVAQRPAAPTEERALPGAMEIPIDRVVPDPGQPRRDWGHDDGERRLLELAASISEFGILQPLLVREGSIRADGVQEYVVIAGGRRRAAAERAGLATIPVIVRGDEGARIRVLQLLENLQRQQLSPLDEARAFQELIDIEGLTPPVLAGRLKLSDQMIRDRLRLLTNQVVADALERKQLNMTAARALQQLPDGEIGGFKERLQRGEEIRHAEIEAHRQRLIAAGVINPRFKGGGRRAARQAEEDQTPFDAPVGEATNGELAATAAPLGPLAVPPDQTAFDPAPAPSPDAASDDGPGAPEAHPVASAAIARELGRRLWQHLPPRLREALRDLARADPSFVWGVALAAGLADSAAPGEVAAATPGGDTAASEETA